MKNNIISLGKLSFNLDNVIYLEPSYGTCEGNVNGKFGLTGKYYPRINVLAVGKEEQISVTFRSEEFDSTTDAELRAKEIIKKGLTQINL